MSADSPKTFIFTGWHMLATICSFFGVIITVNLTMAWYAGHSWSGMVVQNTYVASQQFNDTTAQIRKLLDTGIQGTMTIKQGAIAYDLAIPGKGPVIADQVVANFKRPVGEHQDFTVMLKPAGPGHFTGDHPVDDGHWIVETIATRDGQLVMHEANRMAVIGGEK
ncbi:FixH family protein [Agrobacterium vitis]|uniref:FixH family protein n=1 Tax=Agrobacterium vitis TaxID=373 RepID=UPI001571D060|nr:FixH family protein [Agrobacterium vitis]NSZ16853.1 cation transporter [Agrobacterium vitis]QZO02613.1 FixH family protein [Agrobacterium vitis]UJL87738.1 FixH family protein [Agrobacterium vitis]BCH59507.1 cation transporter [Agrobacterium vitis]